MKKLVAGSLFTGHKAKAGGTADISLKPSTHRKRENTEHNSEISQPGRRYGKAQLRFHCGEEEPDPLAIASSSPPPPPRASHCKWDDGEAALQWKKKRSGVPAGAWGGDGDELGGKQEAVVGCH